MVRYNVSMSPTSLNDLANKLEKYYKSLDEAKVEILQAITDYAYERIMFYVPVDTGRLMNSFIIEVSKDIGKVYTDLYYAKYVEFGTGVSGYETGTNRFSTELSGKWEGYSADITGQKAQQFMFKALQDVENNYHKIVRNLLRKKGLI